MPREAPYERSIGFRRRITAIAFAAAALLTCGSITVAAAQDASPHATAEQAATENDLDTDVTPVAKKSDLWTLVHGAEYPKTEVIPGSVTRFDTDLHAVSFENRTIGLAGGSACAIEPVQERSEADADFGARVAACEGTDGSQVPRVPTLYRYTEPLNQDPRWERLALPGAGKPGYIGAIAWIDKDRALVVGGTGTYPRREPPADDKASTDPNKADPAGKARAWLYTRASDRVEEIDLSSLTPDTPAAGGDPARAGMRGLSAADCFRDPDPQPGEDKIELCFAGALGQIWEWRDGGFNGNRVDALSPDEDFKDARLFRYRVRDIRFTGQWPTFFGGEEGIIVGETPVVAQALTAGCCVTDETKNTPRTLTFYEAPPTSRGCRPYPENCEPPRWQIAPEGVSVIGFPDAAGPTLGSASPEAENTRRDTNANPALPDSWYAFNVRTAGGPVSPDEGPSLITGANSLTPQVTYATLSTTRLLDGDGDIACTSLRRPSGGLNFVGAECTGPDGIPDWVVGELRSTRRGALGTRGLFVATAIPGSAQESVNADASTGAFGQGINCGSSCFSPGVRRPTSEEIASGWEPLDQEKLDAYLRSRHYLLPTYTANAVEIVGKQEDGWAVGDHGAILRLSEAGRQATGDAVEPNPPRLGAPRQKPLADRSAYEDSRPELPDTAGIVPPLGSETVQLDEPQMIPSGSPGVEIKHLVMSRDGSEGWAIGTASGGGPTFSYFDGTSWSECDPLGVEGELEADPACEEVSPLRGYRDKDGILRTVDLNQVARVPLENDADPTNDDELEIIATGTDYTGAETGGKKMTATVRYINGRWRFDADAAKALDETVMNPAGDPDAAGLSDLVFTAPDDGWAIQRGKYLYHFNGKRWIDCGEEPASCGDVGQFPRSTTNLSADRPITGLTTAGERIYAFGRRAVGQSCPAAQEQACGGRLVPFILYRDPGRKWSDGSGEGEDGAGLDPAFDDPATTETGTVESLSVVLGARGYEGWATGRFGGAEIATSSGTAASTSPEAVLMRLDPASGKGWQRFNSRGPFEDYMLPPTLPRHSTQLPSHPLQVTYPSDGARDGAFVASSFGDSRSRIFGFDSARERFEMLDSKRPQGTSQNLQLFDAGPEGAISAMAPDGQGGFWAAAGNYFFHYTDNPPKQVFEEVANPLGTREARLTALTSGPDGSVWAATDSDRVFRYDRLTGWEETRIGWDPGRVVTRSSRAAAIAVGPNGEGLVVGEGGRIADLSPTGVVLDAAAGRSCALGDPPPCGTGRDLEAVDVAPDGSALAGGKRLSLLWRPSGGQFSDASKPPIGSSTEITAISMPTATRAYLATDRGLVFRGDLSGESWTWRSENVSADGEPISIGALNDVAVDSQGHGYAVSQSGILERTTDGTWRRLPHHYGGASAVELPEAGGEGVLIGDRDGRILTGLGSEFRVARHDEFVGSSAARAGVVGFAYLPGSADGSVDAWAGIGSRGSGDSRILRHRSNPTDPLLDPTVAAAALPDAPAHEDGELSLGAFGKSDCDSPEERLCPEMTATTTTNEVILGRIIDKLADRRESGSLDLAVGSGDASDSAGMPASSLADLDRVGDAGAGLLLNHTQRAGQLKHRLYTELVANELADRGVSHLTAIGSQDLSETVVCDTEGCETTKQFANAGENLSWREAFAGRAEPWGDGSDMLDAAEEGNLSFEPAPGSEQNSLRAEDQRADADGEGTAPETKAEIGGANTHYAVDAVRDGEPIARIVFVDTSLRSLAASDALQQPHELGGGQQRFLERMICKEGQSSTFGDRCTREKDQKAIVVSNTPTYSYGPGALTHTATDATTFEATMLRYDVDLVVSGALGYNGVYYTLAPGLHEPCPGGGHPEGPPTGKTPDCLDAATSAAGTKAPDPNELAGAINDEDLRGAYPTLISSGAGGKFGPDGNEGPNGPEGRWHGYSVARLMPDGDIAIEQRPILDWIGLEASRRMIRPREKLSLRGYGRSPISTAAESNGSACGASCAFHYEISTAAITHRYDLLRADPEKPWLPLEDSAAGAEADGAESCEGYVCLPSEVATVDSQSGQVKAGSGKHPPTYAVAMLSVGDEVATTPLFFQPSPSFRFEAPTAPRPTPALGSVAPPGSPTTPPTPSIPNVSVPTPPVPPALVPPPPASPATPPQPPVPPPVPPANAGPSALSLSFAPSGLVVAPTASVIPPPAPPINPAPPGGARKEARQRQAATQKSGADNAEGEGSDAREMGGDMAQSSDTVPGSSGMSRLENGFARRDRHATERSFGALSADDQPSAWARGALYGGGMTLMAAALALGWSTTRPRSRRREPEAPAPATAAIRGPRRR